MSKKKTEDVVAEGKTKTLKLAEGHPGMVVVWNSDKVTKNDDPDATVEMPGKGKHATSTTCAIFAILKAAGIPVAFEERFSENEFLAPKCQMIPLEVIIRRYAVGSYLKRFPNLGKGKGDLPHRFQRLVFELFLKTTGGLHKDGAGIVMNKMPDDCLEDKRKKPVDDPLITDPYGENWVLKHPKIPGWDSQSDLGQSIPRRYVLPEGVTVEKIEELARKTFLVLEGAWSQLGFRLIDFKIEFGIGPNGELLVADVIDNDSWRLRDIDWKEVSKQLFRDNADMNDIADKYALVANLVGRLRIPKQAIVLWRGSGNDPVPEIPKLAGVEKVEIVISGHKSPGNTLKKLDEIETLYPEKGVIISLVGMSNGLGPTLSGRTDWPVIAVPLTVEKKPHDVWSSLETPSQIPLATVLYANNAVLDALNVLAQKNPVAYMHRRYAIEELDK